MVCVSQNSAAHTARPAQGGTRRRTGAASAVTSPASPRKWRMPNQMENCGVNTSRMLDAAGVRYYQYTSTGRKIEVSL